MLIISIVFAGPFTKASTVSDDRFTARSLLAYSKSGTAIMVGDPGIPGMTDDSNLVQAAVARHVGETEKEFAMRSVSFFISEGNYSAALNILFAASIAEQHDTINFFIAQCFEKMGNINLALGANYAARDSTSPFWSMVLFQRASLLYTIGMNQKAEETARLVVTAYRKSTGADSCRNLLNRHVRNGLIPVLNIKSYVAYGLRNYHSETSPPAVISDIISLADTTITSGNGFIKPSLSWTMFKSSSFQCNLEPTLELQLPYGIPRREKYGFGAEINCSNILGGSSLKYGLAARRAIYSLTGPIDTYLSYGFFINSTGAQRSLMLLASGAFQRSRLSLLNGSCINVVAEERSALTIGNRIAFHPGIVTLWTGFPDIDNRFVPWMVAVSGVSEKSNVHQATYYQDTTFTDTIPVSGFKANSGEVLLPYVHPVQTFKSGSYSASAYYSIGFRNTAEIKINKPLSLNLNMSYSASWYPHAFLWDNIASTPSGSDALGIIFYNRDDGNYYYTESLASGEFHQYHQWKKERIDYKFTCGLGAEWMIRPLGILNVQAMASVNRSSIPQSTLFNFNYLEVMPRLDWIVQW